MFINDNDVGSDCEGSEELGEHTDAWAVREQGTAFTSSREAERKKRRGESERVLQRSKKEEEHERACECSYDVHEKERQWTTGRESLKGMASVGWQDGQRERGKYVTAECDKCGRTNRWWLMGSFIHYCDQIQQDSPPYGMAQLIHLITWTTYRTRGGEGMVCVCMCVCMWRRRCLKVFLNMTVNERGSEKNKATTRILIDLQKAQHSEQIKWKKPVTGNKKLDYEICTAAWFDWSYKKLIS